MQYVGVYNDASVGGVRESIQNMMKADPNFGEYNDQNNDN